MDQESRWKHKKIALGGRADSVSAAVSSTRKQARRLEHGYATIAESLIGIIRRGDLFKKSSVAAAPWNTRLSDRRGEDGLAKKDPTKPKFYDEEASRRPHARHEIFYNPNSYLGDAVETEYSDVSRENFLDHARAAATIVRICFPSDDEVNSTGKALGAATSDTLQISILPGRNLERGARVFVTDLPPVWRRDLSTSEWIADLSLNGLLPIGDRKYETRVTKRISYAR